MQAQNTNTDTRYNALHWWVDMGLISHQNQIDLTTKYGFKLVHLLHSEIEEMYLAEHPHPLKEVPTPTDTNKLAAEWWHGLSKNEREIKLSGYKCTDNDSSMVTAIYKMYLYEHPTPTEREVSVRDKAIEWWETFDFEAKYIKAYKALKREVNIHTITDDDIVYIYLHEPEIEVTGSMVGGEWFLNSRKNIIYINDNGNNPPVCTVHSGAGISEEQAKTNAQRIVQAVNGYDKLVAENERLFNEGATLENDKEDLIEINQSLKADNDALVSALGVIRDVLQRWDNEGKYTNLIEHATTHINKAKGNN